MNSLPINENPCPSLTDLRNFLSERLTSPLPADLMEHIEGCQRCQQRLEDLDRRSPEGIGPESGAGNGNQEPIGVVDAVSIPQDAQPSDVDISLGGRFEISHKVRETTNAIVYCVYDTSRKHSIDLSVPTNVPEPYVVTKLLGLGGFGSVWLAEDPLLNRTVAIKVVSSRTAVDAFADEARIAAGLNHPNIVTVHACHAANDQLYLVLAHVDGGSLHDRMYLDGPFHWAKAARYMADVADGLWRMHESGYVHRDIKPQNILWDSSRDAALITDFGCAVRLTAAPSSISGTIDFMAPEAFQGDFGKPMDVYSLGATLFALITGEPPFAIAELTRDECNFDFVKPLVAKGLADSDPRLATIPDGLLELTRRTLHHVPEQRPTARTLASDLRACFNHLLADTLQLSQQANEKALVSLQLAIEKLGEDGEFHEITLRPGQVSRRLRDMKRVPVSPPTATFYTHDRLRMRVSSNRDGYITVLNVGPKGTINLLCPERPEEPLRIHKGKYIEAFEADIHPPAGIERVVAIWSRAPNMLSLAQLECLVKEETQKEPLPQRSTRDLIRVNESVAGLPPSDRAIVVLELEHREST